MNTNLIHKSFARSIATYDANAFVQHKAVEVIRTLIHEQSRRYERVLEIGCGTGLLTSALINEIGINEFFINDLVLEVGDSIIQKCSTVPNVTSVFIGGDVMQIEFPAELDLIVSASTFQWIDDMDVLFQKLKAALKPGACLIFNTFGPQNLNEIRTINQSGLEYKTLEHIKIVASKYFTIQHTSEQLETLTFQTPIDVLKHLRATGVNGIQSARWTKAQLHQFETNYIEKFRNEHGVKLTYHPMYFSLTTL